MNIEEVKRDKRIAQESIRQISQEAEDKISAVVHQFEQRTGAYVTHVDVRWVNVLLIEDPKPRRLAEVKMDVRL